MKALYDRIGRDYDATRRADPRIAQRIISLLNGSNSGEYLDLACGTGNYTIALRNMGLMIDGIDQSELMISRAKEKAPHMEWHVGDAELLPFPNGSFQGVTCILAIHHFKNVRKAFMEALRVINKGRLEAVAQPGFGPIKSTT
jgi:ubiquinone/menaquinone biosynthesis C-methylase UbiE